MDGVPITPAQVAHHSFGVGAFTDLRVVQAVQPAGSVHTLRVHYPLGVPDSQLGGAYLPRLGRRRARFAKADLELAVRVSIATSVEFTGQGELLGGVLANRLEQLVLTGGLVLQQQ